jgi:CheY-like chemotaxis protein
VSAPSRRILLVDDDDDIRLVAGLSLQRVGGHEVESVASGADALDAIVDGGFDLVLLDMQMPGMDGRATLACIRETAAGATPVIVLTASQRSEVADLHELGVVGVLAKPFDPIRLSADVAALMGWEHS